MLKTKYILITSIFFFIFCVLSATKFYRYYTMSNIIIPSIQKKHELLIKLASKKYLLRQSNVSDDNLELQLKKFLKEFQIRNYKLLNDIYDTKIDLVDFEKYKKGEIFECESKADLESNFNQFYFGFLNLKKISQELDDQSCSTFVLADVQNISKSTHHDLLIVSLFDIKFSENNEKFFQKFKIKIETDITSEWKKFKNLELKLIQFLSICFIIMWLVLIIRGLYYEKVIKVQEAKQRLLEEENKQKSFFLANVSHELRTPLNSIIGFSEIIISGSYGHLNHPQYLEYINDINNSGRHLLSIINDILDFSKASSDKLKVNLEPVNITRLVVSSARFLNPRMKEENISLITKIPEKNITALVDPKRLRQAILNLLSNAVKFSHKNSEIIIEIKCDDPKNKIMISIIDNGIGISEENIPRAFSVFDQIDNSHNRKFPGTGLGLPLTKKLIELMGGELILKSREHVGTTVTMVFDKYDLKISE